MNRPYVKLEQEFAIGGATALASSLERRRLRFHLGQMASDMDQVIVSCPPERRVAWAMALKGSGIHGEVLSNSIREIGALGVVNRDDIGITTLIVSTGPLGYRARAMKRALDVGVS
jgi:hypothetical protein